MPTLRQPTRDPDVHSATAGPRRRVISRLRDERISDFVRPSHLEFGFLLRKRADGWMEPIWTG
jgi:hypothetical protein